MENMQSSAPAPTPTPTPNMGHGTPAGNDSQMMVILGYVFPILFFLNMNGPNRFHANQQLLLLLAWPVTFIASMILAFIPILGWLASIAMYITIFVLWIIGIIHGANGEMKPLPIIGGIKLLK